MQKCFFLVVVIPLGSWNLRTASSSGLVDRFRVYVVQCVEAVAKSIEIRNSIRTGFSMPVSQCSVVCDFKGFDTCQLFNFRGKIIHFCGYFRVFLVCNNWANFSDSSAAYSSKHHVHAAVQLSSVGWSVGLHQLSCGCKHFCEGFSGAWREEDGVVGDGKVGSGRPLVWEN